MKRLMTTTLALLLWFASFGQGASPQNIMLSVCGDPATTAAVSWRTQSTESKTVAQILPAQSSPYFASEALDVKGKHTVWDTETNEARGHKVIFTGLEPSTCYSYRVGDGKTWSEWFQFRTASASVEPFSFTYFGDYQTGFTSVSPRILREAYRKNPEDTFWYFAGDIVSSHTTKQWDDFFSTGNWLLSTVPSVVTVGNHEYNGEGKKIFSPQWDQIYTMPDNSPSKDTRNRMYYFDCQGVRFIAMDGTLMSKTENRKPLTEWLEKVLSSNPNKWCVVLLHQPIYTGTAGRKGGEGYRKAMKPLFEKYGVDLVLQGHDHVYCRGFNKAEAGKNAKNLPMYVVSVSGGKMYALNPNMWADRVGSNIQLFQNISFNGDLLEYKCYDATGELYDGFTLRKQADGTNVFAEDGNVRDIPVSADIPKDYLKRYSEEELADYMKRFPHAKVVEKK